MLAPKLASLQPEDDEADCLGAALKFLCARYLPRCAANDEGFLLHIPPCRSICDGRILHCRVLWKLITFFENIL